jgi:hypothetical protein
VFENLLKLLQWDCRALDNCSPFLFTEHTACHFIYWKNVLVPLSFLAVSIASQRHKLARVCRIEVLFRYRSEIHVIFLLSFVFLILALVHSWMEMHPRCSVFLGGLQITHFVQDIFLVFLSNMLPALHNN